MIFLEQSAHQTIKIGPFVDSTDGVTPETGLTISQADVRLTKMSGDFAQKANTSAAAHDENGWYDCIFNGVDVATLGSLEVSVQESGALPYWKEFMVVSTEVYDSLFGTSYLDALLVNTDHVINSISIRPTTGTAVDIKSLGGNGNGIFIQGNGLAAGISCLGGVTGNGITCTGGNTSGHGLELIAANGAGNGTGLKTTGSGVDGHGIHATAGTISGGIGLLAESPTLHGARFTSTGGNGQGLRLKGDGTGNGLISVGGASGTGFVSDITGDITGTIDTCTTNTDMRGTDNALLAASAPTNFGSMGINSTGNVAISWGQVGSAASTVGLSNTTVGVTTVNTDMRGTDNAGTAATLTQMQGAGFDSATDSLKSIRDRGDAAWTTGAGGTTSATVIATRNWNFATRVLTANDNLENLEVDMTKIANSAVSETSNGNLAGNFSTFYDNADAVTIKTVDDVGGGAATVGPNIR